MAKHRREDCTRSYYGSGENPVTQTAAQKQHPAGRGKYSQRYKYNPILFRLGVLEVAGGIDSILLAIATLVIAAGYRYGYFSVVGEDLESVNMEILYNSSWMYTREGVCAAVLLIVSGTLGIKTKKNSSVLMYGGGVTMSTVTANFVISFTVLSVHAVLRIGAYPQCPDDCFVSLRVIHSVLFVHGVGSSIVCIIHSFYCFFACMRGQHGTRPKVLTHLPQALGNQQSCQMAQLQNGQKSFTSAFIYPLAPLKH